MRAKIIVLVVLLLMPKIAFAYRVQQTGSDTYSVSESPADIVKQRIVGQMFQQPDQIQNEYYGVNPGNTLARQRLAEQLQAENERSEDVRREKEIADYAAKKEIEEYKAQSEIDFKNKRREVGLAIREAKLRQKLEIEANKKAHQASE